MGVCAGAVAIKIPAPDCPGCFGDYAFALCNGLGYATCSCKLPPGYKLADAGARDAALDAPSHGEGSADGPIDAASDAMLDSNGSLQ